MRDKPGDRSLPNCEDGSPTKIRELKRTITFNHEWFDNIVPDHLEVRVADPVAYVRTRTSEEIVKYGDFMTQKHEAVDQMRADKTGPTGDKNALAF